jgi:hypothetical protein
MKFITVILFSALSIVVFSKSLDCPPGTHEFTSGGRTMCATDVEQPVHGMGSREPPASGKGKGKKPRR